MVEITWYGHACVGVRRGDARIIMDPYAPGIGLQPVDAEAEIITISHDNPTWHSYTAGVGGCPQIVLDGRKLAAHPLTARGVRFEALVVGEEIDRGGAPNAMVALRLDGLRLVHFGDLGHAVDRREEPFLRADVWFALAGGPPTIPAELLADAWRRLRPRVMIPIHFRTPSLVEFAPVDDLLASLPADAVRRLGSSTVELSPETLPSSPEVWLLDPLRDPATAPAAEMARG